MRLFLDFVESDPLVAAAAALEAEKVENLRVLRGAGSETALTPKWLKTG